MVRISREAPPWDQTNFGGVVSKNLGIFFFSITRCTDAPCSYIVVFVQQKTTLVRRRMVGSMHDLMQVKFLLGFLVFSDSEKDSSSIN